MTGLEIVLIIIGFFCICASFFVARKQKNGEAEGDEVHSSAIWSEKEEGIIRERIDEILEERQRELVDLTEEQMNRLCNEKIMAVDEFSKQLLEKMENNHQEVVFMYNMLNEKEKEIKKFVLEPVKAPVSGSVAEEKTDEPKKEPQTAIEKMQSKDNVAKKTVTKTTQKEKPASAAPKVKSASGVPGNVNLQIQKMYKEGKSILDISKELNIGQGEVKLVIALYGGKRA